MRAETVANYFIANFSSDISLRRNKETRSEISISKPSETNSLGRQCDNKDHNIRRQRKEHFDVKSFYL